MPEVVEHVHKNIPGNGSVVIKVEKNTKGHNWELRVELPITETAMTTGKQIIDTIEELEREVQSRFGG